MLFFYFFETNQMDNHYAPENCNYTRTLYINSVFYIAQPSQA